MQSSTLTNTQVEDLKKKTFVKLFCEGGSNLFSKPLGHAFEGSSHRLYQRQVLEIYSNGHLNWKQQDLMNKSFKNFIGSVEKELLLRAAKVIDFISIEDNATAEEGENEIHENR